MKIKKLIKLLLDCDMNKEVKPYFYIDADHLDHTIERHEIFGKIKEVDDCNENAVWIVGEY